MNTETLKQNNPNLTELLETVVAVDIGTSYIKTNEIFLNSTIRESDKIDFYHCNKCSIKWNDTFYTIGDSYSNVNLKITDFRTKEYKLCLLTAIAFTFSFKTKSRNLKVRLALGLPAEHYEPYHKELEAEVRKIGKQSLKIDCQYEDYCNYGRSIWIDDGTIKHIWTNYEIEILDVVIFKQGATLHDDIADDLKFPLTVIDFGSHLINVSKWTKGKDKPILNTTKTFSDLGFYNEIYSLSVKFESIAGFSKCNESDVIGILEGDYDYMFDSQIKKEIKDFVLIPYVDKVINKLNYFKLPTNENLLLIGGPAKTLVEYISNRLPSSTVNLIKDTDSQFGNTLLFYNKYEEQLISHYLKNNSPIN